MYQKDVQFSKRFLLYFSYNFLPFRRAVFRYPYRGFAFAQSKTHGFFKVRARILDRGGEKRPGGKAKFSLRSENPLGF